LLQILSLKLDNKDPDSTDCPSSDFSNGTTSAFARYKNPSLGEKTLTISTSYGTATASVVLPASTLFYYNKDRDTIPRDSDIVLKWNGTSDWYELFIGVGDTSTPNHSMSIDTILTDTSYIFPKERIPPTALFVRATVYGTTGPLPNSQHGNISGDGEGFATATNESYAGKYTVLHFFQQN
jgi:hypothetical protein